VWHASISVWSDLAQVPWERCGLKTRGVVRDTVFGLIAGVGAGNTRRDRSSVVLHARRRMSDAEIALLDPAWCAIPAVDVAGSGIPW